MMDAVWQSPRREMVLLSTGVLLVMLGSSCPSGFGDDLAGEAQRDIRSHQRSIVVDRTPRTKRQPQFVGAVLAMFSGF